MAQRPVLVVDDDPGVSATICAALARDGWLTETAMSLAEGRSGLKLHNPRIVVVDLGLPDGNGIAFVREVALCQDIGIVVVSGRTDEVDRVVGLEVGADDYLTKPFSPREMVARVRALSRRLDAVAGVARAAAPPAAETVAVVADPLSWTMNGVRLEPSRLRVTALDGVETRLTGGEAGLLQMLLKAPEHLADRESISDTVLGRRLLPEQRGVDQLASSLRQKLSNASDGKLSVAAVRGKGYRLVW